MNVTQLMFPYFEYNVVYVMQNAKKDLNRLLVEHNKSDWDPAYTNTTVAIATKCILNDYITECTSRKNYAQALYDVVSKIFSAELSNSTNIWTL